MLNNDQIKSGQITLGVFPGIWASKNIQILPQRRVPGAPAGVNFVKFILGGNLTIKQTETQHIQFCILHNHNFHTTHFIAQITCACVHIHHRVSTHIYF